MPDFSTANYEDLRKLQTFRLGNPNNAKESRSYSLKDYHWSEFSYIVPSDPDYVQKIVLEEFQPDPVVDVGKIFDSLLGSDWSAGLTNKTAGKEKGGIEGALMKGISSKYLGNLLKAGLTAASTVVEQAMMEQAYKNPTSLIDFPIRVLEQLFPGKFLNIYEMPYFESKYLQSNPCGSWSSNGLSQLGGQAGQKLLGGGMGLEFPTTPKWSLGGSGTGSFTDYEFFLINDTSDHLYQNFKFIHSFIPGTMWLQLGAVQKSPNVYRVIIPGRDFRFFCSVKAAVTAAGKLRRNEGVAQRLNNQNVDMSSSQTYTYTVNNPQTATAGSFNAIQFNTLFPDAYHMKVTIEELSPNHFNNYINYMMRGYGQADIGTSQSAYINQPFTVLKDAYKGVTGVASEGVEYAKDKMGKAYDYLRGR